MVDHKSYAHGYQNKFKPAVNPHKEKRKGERPDFEKNVNELVEDMAKARQENPHIKPVTVEIEYCFNCDDHRFHTHHDEKKYIDYRRECGRLISEAFQNEVLEDSTQVNEISWF